MNKIARISSITATVVVLVGLSGGVAMAKSPASGTWPASFPLPTQPGTVISQTSTTAVVRSTDTVAVVLNKLDALYVTQKGCTLRLVVNKPKDYFCHDAAARKTNEVYFTFAALDPTAASPARSQSDAFFVSG